FEEKIAYFEKVLAKEPIEREDFRFDGLGKESPNVLIEQGKRGGPILSLLRLLQGQTKCLHILLLVGDDDTPERLYHFDMVGACPYTDYSIGKEAFYEDIVLRMATYESTWEITNHELVGDPISREEWQAVSTVEDMRQAAIDFDAHNFFTQMLVVTDLVPVPAINEAVASQYSEGCFTTWDPDLNALIATITGSARPVDKGNITENDLAVIVGVRPDREGAQVRHVEGKDNVSPSSEAVEMMDMDFALPYISLDGSWNITSQVPVIRSKLHGHRGVHTYNPELVEYVSLDEPFYHYLVSCATEAQARAIKSAFARSQSLLNPTDPRQIAFTVLPGHGIVMTEKWVPEKKPFEIMLDYMDAGHIKIDSLVPQGPMDYHLGDDGRMHINDENYPNWRLR
ncbi:MAG: hypothetical protein N2D54_06055, partial [Chloroflexota bacterium]